MRARGAHLLGMTFLVALCTFHTQKSYAETDSLRTTRLFIWASDGNVRHRDRVEPAKDSLAQMGERAAPYLARRLNTSDARERLTLAEIFEKMGKVGTPFIVPYLDSAGEDMPKNAARCLERIKDTAAVLPLLAQMDHPEYSVRSQVATALGKTGDTRAIRSLAAHLQDDYDSDVRKSCAFALGEIGHPWAARPLFETLCDKFYGVRYAATTALVKLKERPVDGRDPHSKQDAGIELWDANIGEPYLLAQHLCEADRIVGLGAMEGESIHRKLISYLSISDPRIRGFAVEALSLKHSQESAKEISKLKAHETDPFVLAQIARFEQIVAEKKNEQSKSK